jgi:hypothetical protein
VSLIRPASSEPMLPEVQLGADPVSTSHSSPAAVYSKLRVTPASIAWVRLPASSKAKLSTLLVVQLAVEPRPVSWLRASWQRPRGSLGRN